MKSSLYLAHQRPSFVLFNVEDNRKKHHMRTMRLNVGGIRTRRWFFRLGMGWAVLIPSKAEGMPDMYNDEMGPLAVFPEDPRKGLWKNMGVWSTASNELLVAPW
jgi:hypothetical protein